MATSSSPRNRSSSGAARNAPSSTFFPNSRPVLTRCLQCRPPQERPQAAPLGWRPKEERRRPTGFPGRLERSCLAEQAPLAKATSEPLHQVVAVGKGALAHLGRDAGPVEQVVELEPRVLAEPGRAGGQP